MVRVAMFSSGAGSAVAAKLDKERHPDEEQVLLFADVNGEHPDNYRFLHEAAAWVGSPLVVLDNGGRTIWDVFREARFLGNTRADVCSRMLKREPMRAWLDENCDPTDTTVVLGFDWTESHRLVRARPLWVPWQVSAPLCEVPLMEKSEAMAVLTDAGIESHRAQPRGLPPSPARQTARYGGSPRSRAGGASLWHSLMASP